jgi:hypothetical protein
VNTAALREFDETFFFFSNSHIARAESHKFFSRAATSLGITLCAHTETRHRTTRLVRLFRDVVCVCVRKCLNVEFAQLVIKWSK